MGPTLYDGVGALRDASPSMLKRAYRACPPRVRRVSKIFATSKLIGSLRVGGHIH